MIEEITGYLILTLCLTLPGIGLLILLEKFKKPIQNSLIKRIPLLMKVNWDTVIKGLIVAGFILFTRKLIYYLRFDGVIQTKFSIWWVEGNVQTSLFIFIFILLLICLGYQMIIKDIEEKGCGIFLVIVPITAIILFIFMKAATELKFDFPLSGQHLLLIIFAPLLVLKILCSGKCLGFFTVFLLGYLMAAGSKELKRAKGKGRINILVVPGFMFLIFLGFSFYQSLGNLQEQLHHRVQSAQTREEIEELLDAANTINNDDTKSDAIQRLVVAIASTGDSQWKKETFQQTFV